MANTNPDLSPELSRRIRVARRDIGSLCFHFTRGRPPDSETADFYKRVGLQAPDTPAGSVLGRILTEGALEGNGTWSDGEPIVCFTEAPISEFAALFALSSLARSDHERLRYEPYGVAVSKSWLYAQGGRPVLYDGASASALLPKELRYRFVQFDPTGVEPDVSWEREWRISSKRLMLDPKHSLVIVPTADEAFQFAYGLASVEPSYSAVGDVDGEIHSPKWLVASLDIFGYAS